MALNPTSDLFGLALGGFCPFFLYQSELPMPMPHMERTDSLGTSPVHPNHPSAPTGKAPLCGRGPGITVFALVLVFLTETAPFPFHLVKVA